VIAGTGKKPVAPVRRVPVVPLSRRTISAGNRFSGLRAKKVGNGGRANDAYASALRTDSNWPAEPSLLFLWAMYSAKAGMNFLPGVRGSKSSGWSRNDSR